MSINKKGHIHLASADSDNCDIFRNQICFDENCKKPGHPVQSRIHNFDEPGLILASDGSPYVWPHFNKFPLDALPIMTKEQREALRCVRGMVAECDYEFSASGYKMYNGKEWEPYVVKEIDFLP